MVAALIEAVAASLDDPEPKPGVALRLIDVLVDARCPDPRVDELLADARERYPDAWNAESVIELQRRRAPDGAARKALDRELVERWLDEADLADPLVGHAPRESSEARTRAQSS